MSKFLFTKIYKPFIAFILVVVLGCIASLPNVKRASADGGECGGTQVLFNTGELSPMVTSGNVLYVSDIKIASAKKSEDAIKELEDAGYYVQKSDLNKGNSGYVYLGYKLSSNRDDAITGLKVANMKSGYTAWDYRAFLKEEAEGLPVAVDGLMGAVSEFKKLYKSGNIVTKYAYETLNVLCVPDSVKQKTGTPLGEYLLSEDRTYTDFETLILILPGSTLTFINNQLAVGCSNNYVNKDGDKLTWVSNPYFLHDIAESIETYVGKVEESGDEAGMTALLLSKYGIDGDTLISKENFYDIIDEPAKKALEDASLGIEIDDIICTSLYDVLFSNSRVLHALFASCLPETVAPSEFGKVLKSYASDTEKRVPSDIPSLPKLISPWMQKATEYLNNTIENPFDEEDIEIIFENNKDINPELEFFVELVENFIYEYWDQKEACADVLEELGYDLTTEEMLQELSSRVAEENEDSDQTGRISSDAFMYLATYEVLKQYRFIDREYFESWDDYGDTFYVTNLADYMELIANTAYDDEETAEALSCAFLSGMSKTDIYLMKTVGIPLFTMDGTISPEDSDKLEGQYLESKEVLIEGYTACGFSENECSIWFGTNKEYLETDSLAMTSASIRREKADEEFKDSLTKAQEDKLYKEHLSDKLEYVGIACAVVGVVMSIAFLVVAKLGLSVSLGSILSMGMFSIMGCGSTFGLGMAGMIATAIGFLTFAIMIILIICMVLLIFLLLFKPEKKVEEEKVERTTIPRIMVDCEEGANNSIAKMVRYDVVTDVNGDAMDLNSDGTGGYGKYDVWNALYYTKDKEFGSPLMVNSSEEYFNVTYDFGEGPALSVSASAFGYTPSYDLNTGSDSDTSIYLHYYTYNSINEIEEKGEFKGKYVESIVMATAKRSELAKNSILRKEKAYTIIDCDLTPDTNYYTYIAFSTTDKKERAVKDIRASIGTSNFSMSWGSSNNTYVCVYDNDQVSCPIKTPGDSTIADGDDSIFFYQLYVSYSDSVGDPILASSLSIAKNLSEVPDGYEYARWFSGGAFDFCVQAENGDFGTQRILCYAPDQAFRYYKDSEDYLAGISFFSGSTGWLGNSEYNLSNWAKSYGYKVFGPDITAGSMHDDLDKTFMAYATTKNPKKAITDMGVFTGEAQGDGMLLDNVCRNGVFFQSSAVFSAGDKAYSHYGKVKERFVRNSHAYITKIDVEANMCDASGWSDYAIKPRGMFLAGPTDGVDPIKVKDVLFSLNANDIPVLRGKNNNIYSLLTGSPLNKAAGKGYKTVHALDKYFYDTYDSSGNLKAVGTNIGVSRNEKTGKDCCLYLFFKNGTEDIVKGKYLASLEIVGSVEGTAFDDARYQAMGAGQEIVNLSMPLYTSPNARYDVSDENVIYNKNNFKKYAESCVFLVASYKDTTSHAIGGAIIAYQDGVTELPSSISRVADYTNKSYTYYKGRYVSPVGYKLGESPEENSGKFAKGYVIYTTEQGDALGRVGVMENGQTGVELGTYFTYLTTDKGELFSANGGYEHSVALYSADVAQYIAAITISEEGYFPALQFELNQKGYRQFIVSDILAGNVMNRYHIGIARTADPAKAIKDVLILNDGKQKEKKINGRIYTRINDVSLTEGTKCKPVFIYTTTGNELERGENSEYPDYPERVAITNIALEYRLGRSATDIKTYWNGTTLDKPDETIPANVNDKTTLIYATNETGKISTATADSYLVGLKTFSANEEWVENHGDSYIVFTNNSGYSMLDYEEGFYAQYFSGSKDKDNKRGVASIVADNPTAFTLIILGVGVVAAGAVIVIKKRKDKMGKSK